MFLCAVFGGFVKNFIVTCFKRLFGGPLDNVNTLTFNTLTTINSTGDSALSGMLWAKMEHGQT